MANPEDIVDTSDPPYRKHWNTLYFADGSNHGAVNFMKVAFGEPLNWDTKDLSPELKKILPINFQTERKAMLSHLHIMMSKNYLAIPAKHDNLIISLRMAWAKELSQDKDQKSYNDLLDALRLSLKGYQIT